MRLFYFPGSTNSRRAQLAAAHLDVSIELVFVDLAKGAQRKPDFLAMNPNGKVPVLEDNGFLLWESHAIMQYLADKTPGQTVYPCETRARADIDRWLFWNASTFQPAVSILTWETIVKGIKGLGGPDAAAVKRGEELVTESARVLDGHLKGREWLSGGDVTLADLAVATPLAFADQAKLPIFGFSNVQSWFERVRGLAAWKKTEPNRG
jgi:glutathione S-transferase